MENAAKLSDEQLKKVSGGSDSCPSGWVIGIVHGVIHYDYSSNGLTFRDSPGGRPLYSNGQLMGLHNGDLVPVQRSSLQGDWIMAHLNGMNGWVNANYIWC